jgi:8-oxo-dGTP pyrophosphatase MutT (NUDIX family)
MIMSEPATPNPASTVVLVRPDRDGGIEVFMNRRPENMETYAGAYVFPGGRVEDDDGSEKMLALTRGVSSAQAQHLLGADLTPERSLAHWVAAVRELFEEAGVHFFINGKGESLLVSHEQTRARLSQKREALQRGELGFATLLDSEQLYCDLSRLIYFFHRVTPEHYRIRFDTRFYLAALPTGQDPLHCPEEVAESLWVGPDEALDRTKSGEFPMMPPTVAVLQILAQRRSWTGLIEQFHLVDVRSR